MTIVYTKKKKCNNHFFLTLHNKILAQDTIDPPKKKNPRATTDIRKHLVTKP